MNMFKSNGGFTLVELIVVIAILAILAGVAVPAYSGYIAKANETADVAVLGSIKTAIQGAYAIVGTVDSIEITAEEGEINKIVINTNVVMYDVTSDNAEEHIKNDDMMMYLNETMPTLKSAGTYADGASWDDNGWEAVEAEEDAE